MCAERRDVTGVYFLRSREPLVTLAGFARRKERPEDGRNLPDDRPQARPFGLKRCIQRVVVIGLGSEHTIHQRQPALAKPVGIGVSLVEPVSKQSLPLGGVTPESSPVLQSRLILIQKSSHRASGSVLRSGDEGGYAMPVCLAHSACARSNQRANRRSAAAGKALDEACGPSIQTERAGFEPAVQLLTGHVFSKDAHSTTLPPLRTRENSRGRGERSQVYS